MKSHDGMTLIVKTVTRLSVWLIILYGLYIILHGHLTPGGGFGGGVVIALAFLNVLLAYGHKFSGKWLKIALLEKLESGSTLLFMLVGLLGIVYAGSFLANYIIKGSMYHLFSAGTIPLLNIILGGKVAMSLFLVVWVMAAFKIEEEEEQ